jgi:hypothetical protein
MSIAYNGAMLTNISDKVRSAIDTIFKFYTLLKVKSVYTCLNFINNGVRFIKDLR